MSRAINVAASEADVLALCRKHKSTISAIEPLASGGTRVVFKSIEATETMRRAFGKTVIAGDVKRVPLWTGSR
jgi:hypothetical protein